MPPGLGAAPKAKSAAPVGSAFALDEEVEVAEVVSEQPAGVPAPAKSSASGPRTSEGGRRTADNLTSEQKEARRAMAATLATSMSAALQAETLKGEEKSAKTPASSEGRVGKIGPAILTGEGVRTASLRRAWWLITIAVFAALGGAAGWCSTTALHARRSSTTAARSRACATAPTASPPSRSAPG
jgi:hypothetical protein